MPALTVRRATPADAEALAAIYNEGIADRVATFETRPRTAEEARAEVTGIARQLDVTYPVGRTVEPGFRSPWS